MLVLTWPAELTEFVSQKRWINNNELGNEWWKMYIVGFASLGFHVKEKLETTLKGYKPEDI